MTTIPAIEWIISFKTFYAIDNVFAITSRKWPALYTLGQDVFQDLTHHLKNATAPVLATQLAKDHLAWFRVARSYKCLHNWWYAEQSKIVSSEDRSALVVWLEDKVFGAVKVTVTAKHVEEAEDLGEDTMIWLMKYLLPPTPVAESKPEPSSIIPSAAPSHCDACSDRLLHKTQRNECYCFACSTALHKSYSLPGQWYMSIKDVSH